MSVASHILKNFNLFVDGVGQAGKIDELQLPALSVVNDEHRAGGMDAPIDIDLGMEKLEATFTTSSLDPQTMKLFGLAEGNTVQLTARGSIENIDGTKAPVVVQMRGKFSKQETGSWKAGEKATISYTVGLRYYKYSCAGEDIHEIDVLNMKRIINGTDQRAEHRANIGL